MVLNDRLSTDWAAHDDQCSFGVVLKRVRDRSTGRDYALETRGLLTPGIVVKHDRISQPCEVSKRRIGEATDLGVSPKML
jgi:hypothetical protein